MIYFIGKRINFYKVISKTNYAFYGSNRLYFNEKYIECLLPAYTLEIKELL